MGQDIDTMAFQDCDVERFSRRLEDETLLARRMFAQGDFDAVGRCAGFELEAWLVDHKHCPLPCNQRVLARLADPLVVPELSQFNIELNGTPQPLKGAALSQLAQELTATWGRCVQAAHEEGPPSWPSAPCRPCAMRTSRWRTCRPHAGMRRSTSRCSRPVADAP